MKLRERVIMMLLVLCLLISLGTTAFAISYTGINIFPGLSGILPKDDLTLPGNTVWATLTPCWGVKVIFVDWDNTELKSETVPVTDTTPGNSSAPDDPTRDGYIFTGWERLDTNGDMNVTLHDDGSVTGVTGPGPIIYIATYVRKVGNLTVSKTVTGNGADSGKAFDFTVTLNDTSVNGTYGDMSFTDGVAAFSLKGGERRTAEGLPAGTTYTVTEADYSEEGYETAKSGDAGTIADGETAEAAFTNTRMVYGNLTVSKTVTGNLGDKTKYFTFTVKFDVEGTFSYTGSCSGTITSGGTVTLKHGESITITDIPAGAHYSVTESDNKGYSVSASGDTGIIAEGQTSAAKFTNSRSDVPKTGDDSNLPLWFSLMEISVLGMAGILLRNNKKRSKPIHLKKDE